MNHAPSCLCLVAVAVSLAATTTPHPSSDDSFRRDLQDRAKDITNVKVERRTPLANDSIVVDAEVTRKEQYLIWGKEEPVLQKLGLWKADLKQERLVNVVSGGVFIYFLKRDIYVVRPTKLPVEAILEVSDEDTDVVTVRLIDRSVVTISGKGPAQ